MFALQILMHINYRHLNLLTEWENGDWLGSRNGNKMSTPKGYQAISSPCVIDHKFKRFSKKQCFMIRCIWELLHFYISFLDIPICILISLRRFAKSLQVSPCLSQTCWMNLRQCQLCPIELLQSVLGNANLTHSKHHLTGIRY